MVYEMARYWVWNPDEGDETDGRDIEALDHEYAAEEFAEDQCSNDCDYYAIYEDGVELMVRLLEGDAPALPVVVTVHMEPVFEGRIKRAALKR